MNETILLLESAPPVRTVIREILERAGYVVLATGDLGTAVDMIADCKPDLLITDTYVAELTGHDAAQILQKRCAKLRVMILAGLPDDQRIDDLMVGQGFELFPQPFGAREFLAKVREMLGEGKVRQAG